MKKESKKKRKNRTRMKEERTGIKEKLKKIE